MLSLRIATTIKGADLGPSLCTRVLAVLPVLLIGFTFFSEVSGVEYRYTSTPRGFVPYGINDAGVLAGSMWDNDAAILEGGVIRRIGSWMVATGINSSGEVAMWSPSGRSFLYTNGAIQSVLISGAGNIVAEDIDEEGRIVGHFAEWHPWKSHAFIWWQGSVEQFDHPDGDATHPIYVTGCDNLGDIVGAYVGTDRLAGFLYRDGVFSTTPTDRPMDINDRGQIVGISGNAGAVYDPSGEISTIAFPGATITAPRSIDNLGRVVGYYQFGDVDPTRYGFVATPILAAQVVTVPRNVPRSAGGFLSVALTPDADDLSPVIQVEIDRVNGHDVEPILANSLVRGLNVQGAEDKGIVFRFEVRTLAPFLLPGPNLIRVVGTLENGLFVAGEAQIDVPR